MPGSATTGIDGGFEIRGLQAGAYVVSLAAQDNRTARSVKVVVAESGDPAPIELVLETSRTTQATVVSSYGAPVPGVQVIVVPQGRPFSQPTTTDVAGKATLMSSDDTSSAFIELITAARSSMSTQCRILSDESIALVLPPAPLGRLRATVRFDRPTPGAPQAVFVGDGTSGLHLLHLGHFQRVAGSEGVTEFLSPGLPPGRYGLVLTHLSGAELAWAACNASLPRPSSWVDVPAGGEAAIEVDRRVNPKR